MADEPAGEPDASSKPADATAKDAGSGKDNGAHNGSKRFGPKQAGGAFLHITALTTFAFAQPLFDLLGKNAEFFAARGSTSAEIIVFALGLVLIPPSILLLVELLVGLAGSRARRGAHLLILGLLIAVVFVQILKKSIDSSDTVLIVLGLAIGAFAMLLYARVEPARSFVSVLTPAPVVFLVIFLFISPVSKLAFPSDASAKSSGKVAPTTVVMLVFDEFPSGSLLDANHHIDAKRYPTFAGLAKDGTWFRNAHSIYDSTSRAVPAIMDGDYPRKSQLPTSSDHPNSIFRFLADTHRMNVSEEATTICPRDLCTDARLDQPFLDRMRSMTDDLSLVYAHIASPPGVESDLPSVSETWGNFGGGGDSDATAQTTAKQAGGANKKRTLTNLQSGRPERFQQWVDAIKPGGRPALNFKHELMPHVPWQYLPDGRTYDAAGSEPIAGISRQSYKDGNAVDQLQMRHLLQAGFADYELKLVIDRLKKEGLYDKSLIVVTADHGVSFRKGQFDRRKVNPTNIAEITPVPLFIKRPDQKQGKIDDRIVETTDILPTIADVLGAKLPAKTDGKSAFSEAVRKRTEVKMLKRDLSGWIRLSEPALDGEKQQVLDKKVRLFGTGADPPDRIYRFGPNKQLLGKRVSSLDVGGTPPGKATITQPGAFAKVDPASGVIPSWITGRVSGNSHPNIAVAVNGVVQGVSDSFKLATGGGQIFGTVVPENAFRQGSNEVKVYAVSGSGRLTEIGSS